MKSRKKMYIFLTSLVIITVMISIAYAALSTTLTIQHGNVTQTAQSWNVGFVAADPISASVVGGTSDVGRSCGTVKATATAVTVRATTLSKPGDKCVWPVTIQNTGSIDAKLDTITFTKPGGYSGDTCTISYNDSNQTVKKSMMVCDNIKYKITTDEAGNTLLIEGSKTITANSTLTVYITAAYVPTDTTVSSEIVYTNAKIALKFAQK